MSGLDNKRRDFIKKSLGMASLIPLSSAVLSTTAFAATDPDTIQWDEEMDVLVVGSGLSGLAAAISAADIDATAKIVVADKMSRLGGSSLISGLNMAVVGSQMQKDIGVTDDNWELLYQDIEKEARGYNHPELTKVLAQNTLNLYNFLTDHGVEYDMSIGGGTGIKKLGGHNRARAVWPKHGGTGVIKNLLKYCDNNLANVEIRKKVLITDILRNNEGRVIGVKVREGYWFNRNTDDMGNNDKTSFNNTGDVKYYKVKRGLVMSSGGFNQDRQFRAGEIPVMYNAAATTQPGATASGIKPMINAGYKPAHMTLFRFAFPIPTEDILWGVLLNPRTCERFVDEFNHNDRQAIGMAILSERAKIDNENAVLIYDQKGIDNYHDKQRLTLSLEGKNGTGGDIWKFETLEELASYFKMDISKLKLSLQKYNENMAKDQDEFGKPKSIMSTSTSLDTAPYYAMQLNPRYNYSQGGALITPKAQAIDITTDEPIPGAFVCGEAAAGTFGYIRLTACSSLDCGIFGMIAGQNVIKEIPWA
ncbi:FAD-binding protein [Photobacterium sp.]|uniref:FAD-dependent oxidoreductase n=1 Tax=Photobacterium sp. TaxID=660 RepID=UPI00299D350F|nr:FAD-binding protein [Photobacterium sp.]MDX1302668.1 FAD-binding protein [Photobacterium sp.]